MSKHKTVPLSAANKAVAAPSKPGLPLESDFTPEPGLAEAAPAETAKPPESRTVQTAAALMPHDPASCKILQQRAKLLAIQPAQQATQHLSQYLRFRLGQNEPYGIPYPYLEKIVPVQHLARVPCTPTFIAGVINYCGELLTILDLKYLFQIPPLPLGIEARIIIVKHKRLRLGLLVDDVEGNESYCETALLAPPNSKSPLNRDYVLGKHAGGVTLLNIAALLEDPGLCVGRSG